MVEKKVQLNLMDLLYKSATLTIVAAAGGDVWSGLPGVLPGSRSHLQFTESVDGITIVTASTDYMLAVGGDLVETSVDFTGAQSLSSASGLHSEAGILGMQRSGMERRATAGMFRPQNPA